MTNGRDRHSVSHALIVQKTYREYLELAKSLLALSETCSIKEWPNRRTELSNAFKLQILYNEREALRFEYLLRNNDQELVTCRALSMIHDRLLKQWTATDETSIRESDLIYRDVLRGIQNLEGKTDSSSLNEPFQSLTRNALYQQARESFAERIKKFDEQLRR
jgi:hypothetical protein